MLNKSTLKKFCTDNNKISYYTPAERVSYLLPEGESSKYDTPEDRAYIN